MCVDRQTNSFAPSVDEAVHRGEPAAFAEQARQELYDFFIQAPAPLVVLLGPEHRFSLVNKPYERFIGGRKVTGKLVREVFTDEEVGDFVKRLDEVYETGEPYIGSELPFNLPDQSGVAQERFINVVYHPYREPDGRVKGILAFHQDVTEKVLARKALESFASEMQAAVFARDEFLSIASHELKTPLTSLKLQAQLHKRAVAKGDVKAYASENVDALVDLIERQTSRLVRLIDEMLDVSRIRSGKLSLARERFELADLAAEVIERLHNQFRGSGYESPAIERSENSEGNWDRERIEQVLTNLLTNAIRYGSKKPIKVRVEGTEAQVRLSVEDQGIGIDESARERIFERFERAVDAGEISGLGLGLFIAKKIVVAHEGRILVESEVGQGSRFTVELPRAANRATGVDVLNIP